MFFRLTLKLHLLHQVMTPVSTALSPQTQRMRVLLWDQALQSSSEEEETRLGSEWQDSDWQEPKCIVNESKIMELMKFCKICGQPIVDTEISYLGAMMEVKWDCNGGQSKI